jgi:arylsulfatase A-like enzyme/Flp pilus assembly protein TadD
MKQKTEPEIPPGFFRKKGRVAEKRSREAGLSRIIFFVSVCFFCLALPAHSYGSSPVRTRAKNILLITIDTLRPDRLSCYSPDYCQTPNIDALAAKGVLFERAFAHTPTTLASHVSIMLGTTPLHHGIHQNANFVLAEAFVTLAEYLKKKGYSTAAFIGAFPLDSRFGLSQGFDVYDESFPSKSSSSSVYPERNAGQVIRSALDWLENRDSPWFSFIHIWDPHTPYSPPEPFGSSFKDDPYSGEVAYVDAEIKKLFDTLENKGWRDDTFIVLTADHGESLGEHGESTHGYFAYNSTIWVPLIMAGPGIEPARIHDYVSHIDIFPSVCDFLGIEKPSFCQGASLVPVMNGKKRAEGAIFFESLVAHYSRGWAPLRGYIEGKEKFIDSPLMEFYDLDNDFSEQNNLAGSKDLGSHKKKMEELAGRLTSSQKINNPRRIDSETREKLRSLGYISSISPAKESYGPGDDLKTLLPLQQKKDEASRLMETNRIPEAVKLLHDIIQTRKDFTDAYGELARIYESQGLREDALAVMKTGFENNPENYGLILDYGTLLVKTGQVDKGIQFIQKAMGIIDNDPDAWIRLGMAYAAKGELQKALDYYEKALALDSNNALIHDNLGFIHFSLFQKTGKTQDNTAAMENFRKAVQLDPSLASAYNGLGGTYKASGQLDEAIRAWEKSLELNPDFSFPLYNLGVAYLEKGNKADALKCLERYLFLNQNNLSPEERRKLDALILKCKN